VNATAYCPGTPGSGCPIDERGAAHCTGFYNDGFTFTGKKAVAGDGSITNPHIIAVDPAVIPLKAMVYLEGYGFAVAEDTGSAIKRTALICCLIITKMHAGLVEKN
jgi:3D (Asp-Asp-Asp) domain-containing protein